MFNYQVFIELNVAFVILGISFFVGLPLQRILLKQHHVGNYAKTEHITFVVVNFAVFRIIFYYFICHVPHCSAPLIRFFRGMLVHPKRKPEINDLCVICTLIDDNILRLQVPVDDTLAMTVYEA